MKEENQVLVRNRYSDKQKYELVAAFKATGSLKLACSHLNIEYETAKKWKQNASWWSEMEEEIRVSQNAKLTKKFKSLADKAESLVHDRLANGDFVFDQRTGEIKRIPVSTNIAHQVWKDAVDRDMALAKDMDSRKVLASDENMKDRLTQLLENFTKFAKATQIEIKPELPVLEGELSSAIHD